MKKSNILITGASLISLSATSLNASIDRDLLESFDESSHQKLSQFRQSLLNEGINIGEGKDLDYKTNKIPLKILDKILDEVLPTSSVEHNDGHCDSGGHCDAHADSHADGK